MKIPINITHRDLCIATAKRFNDKFALYEYKGTASREEPDVLVFGFGETMLFEIKTSLADFNKDQKKEVRKKYVLTWHASFLEKHFRESPEEYVERVIIENVPEFLSWGPLDNTGHPIQNQKGKTFRAFISSLRSLGYSVDWKILTAADYGDPTTRRRLFIQAVKGRKRILLEPSANPRLDIRFRMLKNHELKKAQGFPDEYKILGNATEQTKQIGNAVPVNTAKALATATMSA